MTASRLGTFEQPVDLVRELVSRELRLRYRRSVLGVVWSQLGPLVTLLVLLFVFTRVVPLDVPHYVPFALTGLLAWTWFSAGMVAAVDSVVSSRDLVRQPGFRSGLLPVVSVTAHLIHLVLGLPVLLVAVIIEVGLPNWSVLALPAVALVQFALMLGPGYLLASWNVRFRDVSHIVSVSLLPLFWASPVFYSTSLVPSGYRPWYHLNPLVAVLGGYRRILLDHRWPDWGTLAYPALLGLVLAVIGIRRYTASAHRFAEEL